jgi:hypothetical protein
MVNAMHRSRRWRYRAPAILLASLAGLVIATDAASAAGCVDEVRSLADHYHLSSDPPTVPADKAPGTVRPGDLARSGGVIEPPPSPDKAVITPPRTAHDAMPTVPDVKDAPPKNVPPGNPPAGAGTLGAAETTALQALLVAARAQAERGAEAECRDRLREARELVARAKQ